MLPLRPVIDTNIVISAALRPDGLQRTVFSSPSRNPPDSMCRSRSLSEYRDGLSRPESEYRDVLSRPELKIRRGLQRQFLDLIGNKAHIVSPSRPLRVTGDPDDNIFVECADAAGADYLVTGNPRDFPKFWNKTKVITSRESIDLIAPYLVS